MGADRSNSRQRPCLVRYLRPPTRHKSRGPCFLLVARGNQISYHWGNAHSQAKVTDGKWHHIAVTINQGAKTADVAAQLFIDGKAAEKLTIAGQTGGGSPSGTVSIEELECYVYVRK